MENQEEGRNSDNNSSEDHRQNNYVTAAQLKKEIQKIMDSMSRSQMRQDVSDTDNNQNSEEEDESLIEVSMSEFKIKEHKLEKARWPHKAEMRCKADRRTASRMDNSRSDSTRTDIGIPPIPMCDNPAQTMRQKSAVVLDHVSRKKVYVPAREKVEFFRCPHRALDIVDATMHRPNRTVYGQLPVSPIYMDEQVDRYHNNKFVSTKNQEISDKQDPVEGDETKDASEKQTGLTTRMKMHLFKPRKSGEKSRAKEGEGPDRPLVQVDEEMICYCGSDRENHALARDYSSSESYDRLYMAEMDPSSAPKKFIFREINNERVNYHGRVHFILDNRRMATEPVLQDLDRTHHYGAQQLSPQPIQTKTAVQNAPSTDPNQELPQQEQIALDEGKTRPTAYEPIRSRPERIDIYMFDHQDCRYFHTTDNPPAVTTEKAVHKIEHCATKFWAEIFSIIHVVVAFITTFVLQTFKFVLLAIGRPLTTGLIQIFSDYFFKPLLTITFNGLIQPPVIFLYNILTSFRDLCRPVAVGTGYFMRELAHLVSAFRLCDFYNKTNNGPFLARPITKKV